ncbi:PREDICTED: DNA-directed RNA polymerase III subunit RPC7 [Hipposideros armiger]|uniref:DNA-directed RNA polymerase III subunit RPC7 n=1 Tax=Hipposideros armiger TaxID=186990 RepID=A0A8B7RAK1_HIPAR|nr:PREDICTED: DNA-directed RNA polymerase III subunit RPC7 [Hipposideros armiger]
MLGRGAARSECGRGCLPQAVQTPGAAARWKLHASAGALCSHPFLAGWHFGCTVVPKPRDLVSRPLQSLIEPIAISERTLDLISNIERYSKRYMKVYKEEWIPDWRRLPREMMPRKKCKKAGPKLKKAKDTNKDTSLTNTADVLKKIEELEKRSDGEKSDEENEEKEGSKEKSKEGDDDEEDDGAEQEEYDEEEQEEENDYINSYFEDGDDFGAGSDDNMDEATY